MGALLPPPGGPGPQEAGRLLASASLDRTLKLWAVASGKEVWTLHGHRKGVNGVAFSPDGRRLASASEDRTVRVWDVATGQELLTLSGHTHSVYGVAFSPDGHRLASTGSDGTVKIWDGTPASRMPDRPTPSP